MIVISGALVVVALVLLVIGVVQPSLGFVYGSIGVSLVSLAFLVIGILQRRGETVPAAEAGSPAPTPAQDDDVTTVSPTGSGTAPVAASAGEEPAAGGAVLVVEGRPRYHVEGCRYLTGKDAVEIDVAEAREEGFTPCGVCKPDDALTAAAPAEDAPEPVAAEETGDEEPVVEEDVPGVEVPAARTGTARKTAARSGTSRATTSGRTAAAKAPEKAPAKAAKAPAAKAPAAPRGTVRNVRPDAVTASPAARAAAPAGRPGSVVVIPDRGKFHRAGCRFVRGVEGTEELTRSQADRQGYSACGVCKP